MYLYQPIPVFCKIGNKNYTLIHYIVCPSPLRILAPRPQYSLTPPPICEGPALFTNVFNYLYNYQNVIHIRSTFQFTEYLINFNTDNTRFGRTQLWLTSTMQSVIYIQSFYLVFLIILDLSPVGLNYYKFDTSVLINFFLLS